MVVFHLADHDPSGVNMTADLEKRLRQFGAERFRFMRLGLNMEQVRKYDPPPNLVKDSDKKATRYADEHGVHCWELDALPLGVLAQLAEDAVSELIDGAAWNERVALEQSQREDLQRLAESRLAE